MPRELTDKPDQVRSISVRIDPDMLMRDLQTLQRQAGDAGAADCAVIHSRDIVFNPDIAARVAADDRFPSIHWPLDYPLDDLSEALCAYEQGLFFRPAGVSGLPAYGGGPIAEAAHRRHYQRVYEIVTRIESAAFYLGYHLALGLAAGNCRSVFCPEEKRCRPMIKGQACIRPNIGRPSMEAAGIDARAMATALGWKTGTDPGGFEIAGLVMID